MPVLHKPLSGRHANKNTTCTTRASSCYSQGVCFSAVEAIFYCFLQPVLVQHIMNAVFSSRGRDGLWSETWLMEAESTEESLFSLQAMARRCWTSTLSDPCWAVCTVLLVLPRVTDLARPAELGNMTVGSSEQNSWWWGLHETETRIPGRICK